MPGATKNSRGVWLYSEEIRQLEEAKNETTEHKEPDNLDDIQRVSNISELPLSQESNKIISAREQELNVGEIKETEEEEEPTRRVTKNVTQPKRITENLAKNPYYKLQIGDPAQNNSSTDSSEHVRHEDIRETPPQDSMSTNNQEDEESYPIDSLMAETSQHSKSASNVFTECIKSGSKILKPRINNWKLS
jgi:hypothetical protein